MGREYLRELLGGRWSALGLALLERKPRVVSTCSCGESFTLSEFRGLPSSAGEKELVDMRDADNEEPSFYWSRNCTCGSTIYAALDRHQRVYFGDENNEAGN